ncbi:MAG: extracellular solute-binding protein [Kiritimatiellaeota bacterium]|nr:extracellular solute-binding protein [Kiritimatiellota bacterium]
MSMKGVFLGVFLCLVLLTFVAWRLRPAPAPPGKIPLTWVSDDNPARREQIALFNRLHPDYLLRLDPGNTGMEKVIVQSLAGVGPDLFDCYDGYQLSAYVRSGIAWDVTDALKKAGIDVTRDVWPAVFPNILHEGRVYGFPTNVAVNAIWFNKDIFDAAGIPYPTGTMTWQQFLPLAQKLTVRDKNGRAKRFGLLADWWNWKQFVLQWGGRMFTPDGTKCIIDSPEAIAGVQFFHDLIYRYRVMPSPVEEAAMATTGGWGSGAIHFFGGGKGAMALGGRWWLCTLRNVEGLRLGAFACPFGPKKVYRGYGRATLINAKSSRREAAVKFLLYEAGKPYNDLINHQADALAPVKKYCYTEEYLHDPAFPDEDFNAVWRDVMNYGLPDEVSPFVNGNRATRILNKQLDLVKNDQKSASAALHTAARQINEAIRDMLKQDPTLRMQYAKLTGRSGP